MWHILSTCRIKDSRITLGFLKLQYHSSSSSTVAVGHLVLLLQRLLGILVCLNLVLFLEQAVCLWIKMYTPTATGFISCPIVLDGLRSCSKHSLHASAPSPITALLNRLSQSHVRQLASYVRVVRTFAGQHLFPFSALDLNSPFGEIIMIKFQDSRPWIGGGFARGEEREGRDLQCARPPEEMKKLQLSYSKRFTNTVYYYVVPAQRGCLSHSGSH